MEFKWEPNGPAIEHASKAAEQIEHLPVPGDGAADYHKEFSHLLDSASSFLVLHERQPGDLPEVMLDFMLINGTDPELVRLLHVYRMASHLATEDFIRFEAGMLWMLNNVILSADCVESTHFRTILDVNHEYWPPHPKDLERHLGEMLTSLNEWEKDRELPAVAFAALAHIGILSLRPFRDGNGRLARLLARMALTARGYDGHGALPPCQPLTEHLDGYRSLLSRTRGNQYTGKIAVDDWIDGYASWMEEAAAHVDYWIRLHERRNDLWKRELGSYRMLSALGFVFDIGYVSTGMCMQLTPSTAWQSSRALRDLTEMGVLALVGRGRTARYEPTTAWKKIDDKIRKETGPAPCQGAALANAIGR